MGKYFKISELVKSDTATAKKINNAPRLEHIINMEKLIPTLDTIREAWGKPIRVNSGYRCPELNKAVGGVSNSHHVTGQAVDLTAGTKENNKKLFDLIVQLQKDKKVSFTQLIDEKGFSWVHVGVDPNNLKNQILRL